jgi:4-amino-4-deoxy-L-arabinose transferase-like glycosyltransferase
LVVSLSWMTVVTLVPAHDRPYVDGSCDNSVFSQVFLYNGLERFTGSELSQSGCTNQWSYQVAAFEESLAPGLNAKSVPAVWDRLLTGVFGRDDAWMVVPAAVSACGILFLRRRRPRTDPIKAATLLWSTWLLVTFVTFSAGHYLNSYYVAALIPPMAALSGMGAASAWRLRHLKSMRLVVMLTVAASALYAVRLVPSYVGVRSLIIYSIWVVSALAVCALGASFPSRLRAAWMLPIGLALSSLALLLGSAPGVGHGGQYGPRAV